LIICHFDSGGKSDEFDGLKMMQRRREGKKRRRLMMDIFCRLDEASAPASNTDDVIGALSEINKILILADIFLKRN
jgi:hypothetical protein